MRIRIILLTCIIAIAGFVPTLGADQPSLTGKWSGKYVNSFGFDGEDSLDIVVTKDNTVTGTWDGKKVEKGEKVSDELLQWEAAKGEFRYRARAYVKGAGKALLVEYTVTEIENGKVSTAYTGTSLLIKK